MDELISKQQVMDILATLKIRHFDRVPMLNVVESRIDDLPSVQPDIEDQLKAAYAHGYTDAEATLREKLPEIVYCKDCHYYDSVIYKDTQFEHGCCEFYEGNTSDVYPYDFCSRGVRKNGDT